MQIKRIKAENYKTYLHLDLDLSVTDDKPIILIGGMNGGGKTTLFDAMSLLISRKRMRKGFSYDTLLSLTRRIICLNLRMSLWRNLLLKDVIKE